jgi:hypothetical protein
MSAIPVAPAAREDPPASSPEVENISPARLALSALVMLGVVALLHVLCLHFYPKKQLDIWNLSDYWPLSVFRARLPNGWQWAAAGATVGLYATLRRRMQEASASWQFLVAFGLVVLASLTHGIQFGLDFPTAGQGEDGLEYYQDAMAIPDPLWFLRNFHDVQPVLLVHARTHPPGAVLMYWALQRILVQPVLISVAVAALSLVLTLSAWRRLLDLAGVPETAKPGLTFLYAVLPGVSIYYLAVMDAVFAGVLLWALVTWLDEGDPKSRAWCVVWLFVASLLSFGFLFILPVLAGLAWWRKRGARRLALVGAGLALAWVVLFLLTGFNYVKSLVVASVLENPGGFLLVTNPRGYLWYRLGAVLEIAIFITPFLAMQIPDGLRWTRSRAPLAYQLFWLGTGSVAAMLLSGAMKIGEAARICLFLVPYLLLPIAARLGPSRGGLQRQLRLTDWVFAMGLLMQLGGMYQW